MKVSKPHLHGRISIGLLLTALSIGLVSLIEKNILLGLIYMAILIATPIIISYGYCRHCTSKGSQCPHGPLGKLAATFSKGVAPKYTTANYASLAVPMVILVFIGQYGLIDNLFLFTLYWGIMLAAVLEIRLLVCPSCTNHKCPLYQKQGQ